MLSEIMALVRIKPILATALLVCLVLAQAHELRSRYRRQTPGRRPQGSPPGLGMGLPPGLGGGPPPGQGSRPPPPGQGSRPPPPGQGARPPPPGQGSGGTLGQGSGGPAGQGGQQTSVSEPSDFLTLALTQARSSTCKSPGYTCKANRCGTGLQSVFNETLDGNWRILISNGVPSHSYSVGAQKPNPNAVCIHNSYMKVPMNPTKGSFSPSGMGPVGIALSGGFFYNHLSTPNGAVAAVAEAQSFDSCSGHADPMCRYHYHKVPNCLDPTDSCQLVGYMMDGYPVYSYCSINGVRLRSCYKQEFGDGSHQDHYQYLPDPECHLDEANGYDFGGTRGYGYVFSENYPFVMRGFMGSKVYSICEVY